ncbi:MAG TPA: hypothetical protein VLC74_13865 [Rhizomicrobium sp.]|nr:hypothetical protein [Rhizomicrobium sp.]
MIPRVLGAAMGKCLVENIQIGRLDANDSQILTIYGKVEQKYAVYRTEQRVVVQYADDDAEGERQRAFLSSLNPVRGEINGLIDGWRNDNTDPRKRSKAALFDRRVADALIAGLQYDANACDLLNKVKADVLAERTAIARSQYLVVAATATAILIAVTWLVTTTWWQIDNTFKLLWPMAGFGGLGALFSIALSIRDRSILTDLQSRENAVDAVLRIFIGAISAAVLYCLLRAGLVQFSIANSGALFPTSCVPPKGCTDVAPGAAYLLIILAFVAGFSERLVSGMLASATVSSGQQSNPLAGGPPAKAPAMAAPSGLATLVQGANVAAAGTTVPATPQNISEDDGCVAGGAIGTDEQTADVELPPASGGVADPTLAGK